MRFVKLNHPCLVPIVGFVLPEPSIPNFFGVISRFMVNGSLIDMFTPRQRDDQTRWTTTRKTTTIYLCACVMKFLHSQGISHGFLKPSNILFDENFRPRISGYWMSSVIPCDPSAMSRGRNACYSAPELFEPKFTGKVDVFAWALIVLEIIIGDVAKVKQCFGSFRNWDQFPLPSGMTNAYSDLFSSCLSLDPAKRESFVDIVKKMRGNKDFCIPGADEEEFQKVCVEME
jgi:serine/threonine protein kinase